MATTGACNRWLNHNLQLATYYIVVFNVWTCDSRLQMATWIATRKITAHFWHRLAAAGWSSDIEWKAAVLVDAMKWSTSMKWVRDTKWNWRRCGRGCRPRNDSCMCTVCSRLPIRPSQQQQPISYVVFVNKQQREKGKHRNGSEERNIFNTQYNDTMFDRIGNCASISICDVMMFMSNIVVRHHTMQI